jgi:hypothetical protein
MSKPTDYYQILGVTPSADLAVIKAVLSDFNLPIRDKQQSEYLGV